MTPPRGQFVCKPIARTFARGNFSTLDNCMRTFERIIFGLIVVSSFFLHNAESGQDSGTGIEGVITISPAFPGPTRVDAPDSKPLPDTAFVVQNEKGEVASFTTDEQGRFKVSVPAGHYTVALKGRKGRIGRFGPFEVDVVAGKMTQVEWKCDSGIR